MLLLLYHRLMSTLAVTAKRVIVVIQIIQIILHHIISTIPIIIIAHISIPITSLFFLDSNPNKPILIQQTLQTIILVTNRLTPFSLNL